MKNTDLLRLALADHTRPIIKRANTKPVSLSGQAMVVALCVEENRKEAGVGAAIRGAFGAGRKLLSGVGGAANTARKALPAPGGAGRIVGLSPLGKRVATGVGGLALGGAGYLGGNAQGRQQGATQAMEGVVQNMESMPWQQRLGYLFAPQAATNKMVEQVNGVIPGFSERIQRLRMGRQGV